MIIVRHGLMVVGLPFSGKTAALKTLANAIGINTSKNVIICTINPKSITNDQLYGVHD